MRTLAFCVATLIWLSGQTVAWGADAPCGLQRVAELPIKAEQGRLLIQLQIEGHDAWVQVDTGSPFDMISSHLVDELKLRKLPIASGRAVDGAGKSLQHYVHIKKLTLSGMTAEDQDFIVMGESSAQGLPYDGIFGTNFLSAYDVELDMPHGKMNLFTHDHCKGQVVYWTRDYAVVPFVLDASLHIVMTVMLDGQPVRAVLDTGAGPSILSAQTARRTFNVDPANDGTPPDGQVMTGSGATMNFYRHRFGNLDVGGVQFHNTELEIVTDKLSRIIHDHESITAPPSDQNQATSLTIGLHHLSRIRAYIAYDERKLYISAADATQ